MPSEEYALFIDGGSRGNPGVAGCGAVLKNPRGETIAKESKALGQTTNNVAEYHALLLGLEAALRQNVRRLKVFSDSELLVRQLQGKYKVRSADLRPLFEQAQSTLTAFDRIVFEHIPRERNREADALANQAMDGGGSETKRFDAVYRRGAIFPVTSLHLPENSRLECVVKVKKH